MRTEIPLLQNVRIASPCSASWEEMTPIDQDRVRFCDGCQKRVYNLSALCQAEAEGLLRAHEGHLCVRYYRRHDGTILTADCPVGLRAARRLVLTHARVSIGLCMLLCAAFAAHHAATRTVGHRAEQPNIAPAPPATPPPPPPKIEPLMGSIAPPPPPAPPAPQPNIYPLMGEVAPQPRKPFMGKVQTGAVSRVQPAPEMGDVDVQAPRARTGRVAIQRHPPVDTSESEMGKLKTYDRER